MLHAHFTAVCVCIDAELLAMEFLHCAEVDSCMHPLHENLLWTVFSPVTLTLTRWPSQTNLTRNAWRYTRCASM